MRNAWKVVPAMSLAVAIGCESQSQSTGSAVGTQSVVASSSNKVGEAVTFVSLKVPNMVWGGCAASVRGDLTKIDGVTDIITDPDKQTCSFKLTQPGVDYKAELETYAKTNSHLAGYTIE